MARGTVLLVVVILGGCIAEREGIKRKVAEFCEDNEAMLRKAVQQVRQGDAIDPGEPIGANQIGMLGDLRGGTVALSREALFCRRVRTGDEKTLDQLVDSFNIAAQDLRPRLRSGDRNGAAEAFGRMADALHAINGYEVGD